MKVECYFYKRTRLPFYHKFLDILDDAAHKKEMLYFAALLIKIILNYKQRYTDGTGLRGFDFDL